MSEFLDLIISSILGFFGACVDSIFGLFYDFFNAIYGYLVDFVGDKRFEAYGYSFFSVIFSKFNSFSFSFNLVYWAVGLVLGFYILKNVVIPLIISVVDDLIDTLTPS